MIMKDLSLLPWSGAFDENKTQLILDQKVNHPPPRGNAPFYFHIAPKKTGSTESAVHPAYCVNQIDPDNVGGVPIYGFPICWKTTICCLFSVLESANC